MLKSRFLVTAAAGLLLMAAGQAAAADLTIKMLNKGADGLMVFEPAVVKAKPGDTLHFVPTSPSHNAEMVAGMVPGGVPLAKGVMNKELVVKVTKPGVYVFKCNPHYAMGMVAVIQVGAASNKAAVVAATAAAPPQARRRLTGYLARVN
ncbi:pseudoazurin [Caulobacter sp. NIBR1757]|uniref:pseudoazurin n=1 Tax=Caulobacter sp. NIBR1757 TaxID=3016000 RepID=UPI0022F05D76|nr:pseudoazurin [Caulobacter sp. NIBR1757]WGM39121.1 Pseudoazurin [Caulobacter sp. NIBR1757]